MGPEIYKEELRNMFCPNCHCEKLQTINSRESSGNSIRRRKKCTGCGCRFTTYERIEMETVNFVKGNKEIK